MCASVRADEAPDSRRQADESAQTVGTPTTTVVELGENFLGRGMVSHGPENDQKREEADDMSEEDNSFGQWEVVCCPDVEGDEQEGECEHE